MRKLFALSLLCAVFTGVSVCAQDTMTYTTTKGTPFKTTSKYGKIEGAVIDDATNSPMTNVAINVLINEMSGNERKCSKPIRSARVDKDGKFRIDSLLVGKYRVQFVADDTSFNVITYTNVRIRRGLIIPLNSIKLSRRRNTENIIIGPARGMIDYDNTGTVRKVSAEEINKLPGH